MGDLVKVCSTDLCCPIIQTLRAKFPCSVNLHDSTEISGVAAMNPNIELGLKILKQQLLYLNWVSAVVPCGLYAV